MILRLKNFRASNLVPRALFPKAREKRPGDEVAGRGPNLRSCDLPRSVLVTGFSPENGHQLPVISGNIHVKLASSGVGRFQK